MPGKDILTHFSEYTHLPMHSIIIFICAMYRYNKK